MACAQSASPSWACYHSGVVVAVLIDIDLPDIHGNEVCRRLRSTLSTPPTLVAISGFGEAQDRQRSLEAGFDAYVVKPVDPANLAPILAEADPGINAPR